jgi:hypothetical protein
MYATLVLWIHVIYSTESTHESGLQKKIWITKILLNLHMDQDYTRYTQTESTHESVLQM